MTKSQKIVFFGNERLATGVETKAPTLQKLLSHQYEVVSVVSKDSGTNRTRKVRPLGVEEIANANQIAVLKPQKLSEAIDSLRANEATIAVLVAYGKIVPQEVIDIFPNGIINIHPSLLPFGRGPTPIEEVILSGASKTGVSLMKLSKKMDAGQVYAQQELPLDGTETKQSLADNLLEMGSTFLMENLPNIINGTLKPKSQDDDRATYNSLIRKDDGKVDWHKPAKQLERAVRAYAGWPKSWAKAGSLDIIITQAAVQEGPQLSPGEVSIAQGHLLVGTSEKNLDILRLALPNKGEMSTAAFIAGYASKL